MKKLALVFGGGSAKGYAHIGVLKELEKHGIVPDLIVGTSMGALVGGMYASGKKISDLESLALNFNSMGSFDLISTIFKDNLLNINKVKKILDKELKETKHEDCKVKFVAMATNMNKGVEHRFDTGPLKDSILASISIPAVFPRVNLNGDVFCDGGLTNNLPEDVAKELMPNAVVVSVDVIGEYSKQVEKCKMKTMEAMINASTLMTANLVKSKPQYADLRLSMTLPTVSQLDFRKETTAKTIKKGELFARKYINKIMELLKGE